MFLVHLYCVCVRERDGERGNEGMFRQVKGEIQSGVSVPSLIRKLVSSECTTLLSSVAQYGILYAQPKVIMGPLNM